VPVRRAGRMCVSYAAPTRADTAASAANNHDACCLRKTGFSTDSTAVMHSHTVNLIGAPDCRIVPAARSQWAWCAPCTAPSLLTFCRHRPQYCGHRHK
jgi:hypothetical protein